MREYSCQFFEREKQVLEESEPEKLQVAFCGNIANSMYLRAKPLINDGMNISIFIHPDDNYIMSQPFWEEYNGTLSDNETNYRELIKKGYSFPNIKNVKQNTTVNLSEWFKIYNDKGYNFLKKCDIQDYQPFLTNINTLCNLQNYDVIWGTQILYMAYLARLPYIGTQCGGDLWFEASRGDNFGRLMRLSFGNARVLVASNPWSFAHARRFGFRHMVYLPLILNERDYYPSEGYSRNTWKKFSDGNFFVLTSSRLDEKNKGSMIGLDGFAQFSKKNDKARLVFIGWGKDSKKLEKEFKRLGIDNKIIKLPISGKAKVRDYLRSADVFIDQFVLGYFGSAGLEAMACGLPVIGRIETEQYAALCETGAPPILNCSTVAEVAERLESLYQSSEYRRKISEDSARWFVQNHGSGRWLDEHRAILAATAAKMPVTFDDSPLAAPLDKQEKIYLQEGLCAAPKTMDYGW